MVFPQTPLSFTVELWYDGAWQNITSDVRHSEKITITRGRRAESGQPEPASCRMTLRNQDARYTPGNPLSPLYGKIGRNTLLRVMVNGTGRFIGEVSTWPPQWTEGGQDAWVSIEASGILRRIDQRKSPLQSTLRRRITSDPSVLGYWPMEEDAGATSAYSPLPGVSPMRVTGFTFAAEDSLAGSAPLPSLAATASMQATVPASTSTGQWTATCLFKALAPPSVLTTLMEITTSGTAARSFLAQASPDSIRLTAVDADGGTTVLFNFAPVQFYEGWVRLETTAAESGGNTTIHFGWRNLATNTGFGADYLLAGTSGAVTRITSTFGPDAAGTALGHLGVFSSASTFIYNNAEQGFVAEAAHTRFQRMCAEEGISSVLLGSGGALMGPQSRGRLLDLLFECADADGGMIYESRVEVRLNYRTRVSLYNQAPKLALDYRQHLVPGLQPVTDDQTIANDVTVSRVNGSSARSVQSTGPLSVQDAPAGVGKYDQATTVNTHTDDQLPDIASWTVHLGTVDEPRYPAIPINLARNYALADAASALTVGDRITVTNTPALLSPDGIDVILQGITETIASTEWTMTFIGSPASPWTVAVSEDADRARTDSDSSTLTNSIAAAVTTLPVAVGVGPAWVQAAAPLNSNPTAESLTGWAASGGVLALVPLPAAGPFVGANCVQFTPTGGIQFTNASTAQVAVVPGQSYTVSGWVRSATATAVSIGVNWYTNGAYTSTSSTGATVAANTWRYFTLTATAPAGVTTTGAFGSPRENATSSDVLWVKHLTVRRTVTPSSDADFPFDVTCSGERVTVAGITPSAVDAFTRTVTGGWGSADSGQAWTASGGTLATDYATSGGTGRHIHTTRDVIRLTTTAPLQASGTDTYVSVSVPVVPTGDAIYLYVTARHNTVTGFYYFARVVIATSGAIELSVRKRTPAETLLSSVATGLTHTAGATWRVRLQVDGSTIRAKVWPAAGAEPTAWGVSATDTDITAAGVVGLRSYLGPALSNTLPVTVSWSALAVGPQLMTVTRSVNGVVKTLPADSDVRLATPAIVAL